jgi:pyruvate/2-oxoglutarate dehydrogenase complex dihydrolipoamide dehydrogenase (E3) component
VAERVVVLGGGSTGEAFAAALRRQDARVEIALVERERVGGECSYFACMPSKTLLRAPEVIAAARRAPGASEAVRGELDAERVFWWRDQVTGGGDDSSQADYLRSIDVELVRGSGRVARPGVLDVDGRELAYGKLVIATGSAPAIPPIPGLEGVEYWTNREATSTSDVPESIVVLGAGPVGCELAQFFRRMGARVAIVDRSQRLLSREDADAAALLQQVFEDEGIELHLGASVDGVEPGIHVTIDGRHTVQGERLLVATGRSANVDGFGFEQLGIERSDRGIAVDERLRAAEGVWAIGDVTGVAMFTHVGKYQARVAAVDVAGGAARADYRAIPRTIFTDPQLAAVGTTEGDGLVTSTWRVESTARTSTYERPKRDGFVRLLADPERRVLVGGVAVGPEAGEWLQQIALAIRAEVPVDVLRDTIQPYPTFSEAIFFAARDLPL